MSDALFADLALCAIGSLLCWTAVHAVAPDVDRHRSPGLRTPATLSSQDAWLAAHRRIQPVVWRSGLCGVAVSAACSVALALGWSQGSNVAVVLGMMALFLPCAVRIMVVGDRAASRVA